MKRKILIEINKCLNCKDPQCVKGCPLKINIPKFISFLKKKDLKSARKTIEEKNFLLEVTSRVCHQDENCEAKCVLSAKQNPVKIGMLEKFVADNTKHKAEKTLKTKDKVSLIGAGPFNLNLAFLLSKKGFQVSLYDGLDQIGGVLYYGIPHFRLPKKILKKISLAFKKEKIPFFPNKILGQNLFLEDIPKPVFLGTGAGSAKSLNIEGENLNGVFSANEILSKINMSPKEKLFFEGPIGVIGGGNVAVDAARSLKRLTRQKVIIIYRRDEKDMPARKAEIANAKKEGIEFLFRLTPKKINGKTKIISVTFLKTTFTENNFKETFEEKTLFIKTLVYAIGSTPNQSLNVYPFEKDANGFFITNNSLETNIKKIYAGGDCAGKERTVVGAIKESILINEEIK